jgi:hypothetical protein
MFSVTAVFGSNLVNRYGSRTSVAALENLLSQRWNISLPSAVSHDIHRATGYNDVTALLLQPGLARLIGTVDVAETAQDMAVVRSVLDNTLSRQIAYFGPAPFDELRNRIGSALSSNAQVMGNDCVSFFDPQVASRKFAALFDSRDKDGLIFLKDLNPVAPGVFEKDGLLLFAHRYFRRALSHHNSLNDPFLARFAAMREHEDLNIRIALDEDLIGLPETLRKSIELQYWWGPHFSDDLNANPSPALTRHKADENEEFFNAIASTEFWWYSQDKWKSFECEELRSLNIPSLGVSKEHFGCRFIHSMVDPSKGLSVHLDGAIRMYDEDLMLQRVDLDLYKFGRRAVYTKLWRIDGALSVQNWKSLINDYYRDNHLVGEYLGGQEEGEVESRPSVVSSDTSSIYNFVPGAMSPGEGVRIAVSYQPRETEVADRRIIAKDRISRGDEWFSYVESCSIEFRKLIERRGASVTWPDDVRVVAFEDTVDNFPLVSHDGPDALTAARVSLEVIRQFCDAMSTKDRMIGFHLSIRFTDKNLLLSLVGHVEDMAKWLSAEESALPTSLEEVGSWAEKAAERLTALFPDSKGGPSFEQMLKGTGLQILGRRSLLPGEFSLESEKGRPLPTVIINELPTTAAAITLLREHRIVPTFGLYITCSSCSRCGHAYATCGCVKNIDPDVGQTIEDCEIAGVYWTNRPVWDVLVKIRPEPQK